MKPLRTLVVLGGVACLSLGFLVGVAGRGAVNATAMGHALIVAGAILIAGAVIASAIAGQRK